MNREREGHASMEHLNKRKPNLLFFWFLLPFLLYAGYAVGKLEGKQISISNLQEMLLYSLTHPWPVRFTILTVKAILIFLLIWGFAVIWYIGNYRSLIPGLEYGSAKFADPKQVNAKLRDADEMKNKILSENIRMSIDTRKTGLNNNVTVIGGSGAGKSFYFVLPNTESAREVYEAVKRGDLSGMSFAFTVPEGGDSYDAATNTRTIYRIAKVYECSVVPYAAYPTTSVEARGAINDGLKRLQQRQQAKILFNQIMRKGL